MSTVNADPEPASSLRPINDRMGPGGRTARSALPGMGLGDRMEAWLSKVSNQNELVRKLFSSIWLPYAFRSGITMKSVSDRSFVAVLPFRRFNRNWYNAMAGAALLVGADAVRQCIDLGGGRLPLGAVTAALGGVAFLVLVRRTAGEWRR